MAANVARFPSHMEARANRHVPRYPMSLNPPKALIALVALVCMTLLLAVGAIETDQGLPIISLITGYSVGNGLAAMTGKDVEPIIKKRQNK